MLNGLQGSFQAPLGGMLAIAQQGAMSLFIICWIASTPWIIFQIIDGMQRGGGAGLIQTIGLRIAILTATLALVTYWVPFANGVNADIQGFGARLAGTVAEPVDFSPDGVVAAFSDAGDVIKRTGEDGPFAVLDRLNLWKLAAIGAIEFAGIGCAIMLLIANISFALTLAIGSVCVGLISSPWLKGFLDQFIRVLVGSAIFTFGVGVFVSIGMTFAKTIASQTIIDQIQPMPGKDMVSLSVDVLFCFALAMLVPTAIAGRIAGGGVLTGISELIAFSKGRF